LYFSTEPFFPIQNLKKGFVRDGSACGYSSELSKGSVEFFIFFLRLWTHLDAFRNLQNLFGWFCKPPFFLRVVVNKSKAKNNIREKIQQISIRKGLAYDKNIKSQTYNKNVYKKHLNLSAFRDYQR
jgi:hypothetical protein